MSLGQYIHVLNMCIYTKIKNICTSHTEIQDKHDLICSHFEIQDGDGDGCLSLNTCLYFNIHICKVLYFC
jgi:hypothetical protein